MYLFFQEDVDIFSIAIETHFLGEKVFKGRILSNRVKI